MYRIEILFGHAKISKIFWGMPDMPDIFESKQHMLGPSLRSKTNLEYPCGARLTRAQSKDYDWVRLAPVLKTFFHPCL